MRCIHNQTKRPFAPLLQSYNDPNDFLCSIIGVSSIYMTQVICVDNSEIPILKSFGSKFMEKNCMSGSFTGAVTS